MKEENTYRQTIPSSTTGRYTALTRKAMRICYAAHEGQMDKSGVPYVFHPIHLAEQMETEGVSDRCAGGSQAADQRERCTIYGLY